MLVTNLKSRIKLAKMVSIYYKIKLIQKKVPWCVSIVKNDIIQNNDLKLYNNDLKLYKS